MRKNKMIISSTLYFLEQLKRNRDNYTYHVKLKCLNCLDVRIYNIPKKMSVNEFGKQTDCLNCNVKLGKLAK